MTFKLLGAAAASAAFACTAASAAVNLPQLHIDTTQATVSGLSSGGAAHANGSSRNTGLCNVFTVNTLKMTAANYDVMGTCP